ncbi:AfsR/SARP family transcriptional regulator [Streptomyces gobiensis]|uniref:AfsR/SARP family transcriptional regulator n=1 Tax=Streptomyces gobiensis TaxID=2875706 RepID=UPI00241136A9|nr:AfsR/SARP family transcriptional regulator [Streptomyces gobiensis]UGY92994.1 AfsR/SARP family transcriptional regulator [Streptomyces gobiensis]
MRFNLIGPFEIITDEGRAYTPRTPKVCQLLALLLTRPNEIVMIDSLIRELWGCNPPRSALTTLQTYVYHSRKMFANEGLTSPERELLLTRPPGYLIRVDAEELDTQIFERLIRQGRDHLANGEPELAAKRLRDALALWRGPALANISAGEILMARISYLEELRIRAVELRIEADKQLGRHRELIPELRSLVKEYPFNEWFHGQLIDMLNTAGRRAEALQAYQNLRKTLHDELGLEPSTALQQLQYEVLSPPFPEPVSQ